MHGGPSAEGGTMAMRTWNEKLYFGAMPGRYEAIETWLAELAEHRIDRIVCLAPQEEITRRSPAYHLWRAKQHDYEITDIPVPDYGIPEGRTADEFGQVTTSSSLLRTITHSF
jgi:hypothetical protein